MKKESTNLQFASVRPPGEQRYWRRESRHRATRGRSRAAAATAVCISSTSRVVVASAIRHRTRDIGYPKLFMVGKASVAEPWPRPTVNNFVAARGEPIRVAVGSHVPVSVNRFSRPGGPGLLTHGRFNDYDLYRPARRAGLGPLTTTQEGVANLYDDSSILPSPGQACGRPTTSVLNS